MLPSKDEPNLQLDTTKTLSEPAFRPSLSLRKKTLVGYCQAVNITLILVWCLVQF